MVPSPAQAWAAQVFVQVTGMLVRTTLQLFGSLQVHTYSLYTYICSPFEVLEKGRHALHGSGALVGLPLLTPCKTGVSPERRR